MHGKKELDVGIREFSQGKKTRSRFFFELSAKAVTLSVVISVAILAWQAYSWTMSSTWPSVRLADALAVVGINPEGMCDIKDAGSLVIFCQIMLDLPASLMMPLLTTLFFAFVSWFL
jgi:hypothetical protein